MNRLPDYLLLGSFLRHSQYALLILQTLGLWVFVASRRNLAFPEWLLPLRGRWASVLSWGLMGVPAALLLYGSLTAPVDPDLGSLDDAPLWLEISLSVLLQLGWALISMAIIAAGYGVYFLIHRVLRRER
jgi:hypothetical protein